MLFEYILCLSCAVEGCLWVTFRFTFDASTCCTQRIGHALWFMQRTLDVSFGSNSLFFLSTDKVCRKGFIVAHTHSIARLRRYTRFRGRSLQALLRCTRRRVLDRVCTHGKHPLPPTIPIQMFRYPLVAQADAPVWQGVWHHHNLSLRFNHPHRLGRQALDLRATHPTIVLSIQMDATVLRFECPPSAVYL